MFRNFTKYLVSCLICLQVAAPFIHAHAFGADGLKAHIFHVHTVEISNTNNVNSALSQAHVGEIELIGAVTTVATGIKTVQADTIADGIAAFALFFTLALLIFDVPARLLTNSRLFLPPQHSVYSQQTPRAPPA